MKKKYLIADLLIKISGINDDYLEKMARPYLCHSLKVPDVVIETRKSDDFIENRFKDVIQIAESQYFHEGDSHDSVIFYDENLCRIVALIQFDKSYTHVSVNVCNLKRLCSIRSDRLLFNVLGIAMQYLIRMKNGFVFHSSAVSYGGKGIAFSAPSGVGKSTHTSMWIENEPDTVMINDDTPILRVRNGVVYLYGSPWAGTTGLNANIRVVLDSVVFLEQNPGNHINEISTLEAMKLFLDGVRPSVTHAMHLESLNTLDAIMRNVRMYLLMCNKDVEAMHIVKNKIIQ